MKLVRLGALVFLCLTIFFTVGCKKQQTTLQEPKVEKTPVDTSFKEPKGFDNVDTSDEASFTEAELDEQMRQLVKENMKPIYFGYNSFVLTDFEKDQLATAGNFMLKYPNLRILVEGHCDERGSSEYNMGLGENRAKIVKEYLVNFGIEAIRFETTSWGKEKPAEPGCGDDQCHQLNRRAEFKVLAR